MTGQVNRRTHLKAFIGLWFYGIKRKYTGEPYTVHLENVGSAAEKCVPYGYEIGLCHDLFEDTQCTWMKLYKALKRFGYSFQEARYILMSAVELTDVYTKEAYPEMNRKERKNKEAKRLGTISKNSQTVKLCDLDDNTESIVTHDPSFAKVYLQEKEVILSEMKHGDSQLYKKLLKRLQDEKAKIN